MSVPASVTRRGNVAAAAMAARLADAVREQATGVQVDLQGAEVIVTGHGVLSDPALRWPAGLLR